MKAVQIHEFGDVDVLTYEEVEWPEPQSREVLVRVWAADIHPVDALSRQFPLPFTRGAKDLPSILGWDISGEVVCNYDHEMREFFDHSSLRGFPLLGCLRKRVLDSLIALKSA